MKGLSKTTFSNFHSSLQQEPPAMLKGMMGYYQNNSPCLREWNQWNHQPWYFTGWVSFLILENGQISKRPNHIVTVQIYLYDRRDPRWTDFFFLDWITSILLPPVLFMSFGYMKKREKNPVAEIAKDFQSWEKPEGHLVQSEIIN